MTMLFIENILFVVFIFEFSSSQIIQTLNELIIEEELPIGSIVTSLTDKIANLDQSIEYDLVKPLSNEMDLFSINHSQHSLIVRNRIDYEKLCSKLATNVRCSISVSIAVANIDTIDVYMLPIRILNIDDNHLRFPVNRTVIEIEENDSHWFEKSYALPRAIDDDGDPISYSLYLQNWQKPTNLFDFDEIHLRLKPLKMFDREEENVYLLRLVAHNHHDLSLDVIVLIKDENDHSPRCEQNSSLFIIDNVSSAKTFFVNATDLDEGENGRLQFVLTTSIDGFSIDRSTGQIRFEPKFWSKSSQRFLTVNISDHGQSKRLSTECFVEIRFENFYQIDFQSDRFFSNTTEIFLSVENLRESIGHFRIFDRIEMKICFDCQMKLRSNFDELFIVNSSTFDVVFNETSNVFQRILTNHFVSKENLSVDLTVEIFHREFSSFVAEKTFHFLLHFDKETLLKKFRRFYLRLNENLSLYHRISLSNLDEICSNRNETNENLLIDPTDTFVLDRNFHLVLKKILRVDEKNFYHLKIENRCSIDLFIYVVDRYSSSYVFPHLNESFRILSSRNLNEFSLGKLPFGVKYLSSVPELIAVDSTNGSIRLLSPTIRTFSYYDFQIEIDDNRTPSFSSSLSIRIFFIVNENSPMVFINESRQTIEIDSSKFLFQINAFDPDLFLTDQTNIFPPSIEFDIEQNEFLYVERFSGRIFARRTTTNERSINFTLIVQDFGFPQRLINRYSFSFDLKTQEQISIPLVLLGTSIVVILTILIGLIFILIVCCCCCFRSSRIDEKSTRNLSPHTADTRLIDHEYFATSLPRLSSREQRLFISHSIDKLPIHQQSLSMTDINKYLERFEKIYHDSSSQQYLHQPIGSVV